MKTFFVAWFIVLRVFVGLQPSFAQKKDAQALLKQALQLYDADQYQQAVSLLDQVIALEKNNATAYFKRGYCFSQLDQEERAIADFKQTLVLDPTYKKALTNLASIYQENGEYELALQTYRKYIALVPNQCEGWAQLGITHASSNQVDSAFVYLAKAIDLDSACVTALTYRTFLYEKMENLPLALQDANQAVKVAPKEPYVLAIRGNLWQSLDSIPQAWQDFSSALAIDSTYFSALVGATACQYLLGAPELSLQYARKVFHRDADELQTIYYGAMASQDLKAYDQAIAYFRKAQLLQPENLLFFRLEAKALLAKGDIDQALIRIQKVLAREPDRLIGYYTKAIATLRKNTANDKLTTEFPFQFTQLTAQHMDSLDVWLQQAQHPYQFDRLLSKLRSQPLAMGLDEYFMLYYGSTAQSDYAPYGNSLIEKTSNVDELLKKEDYKGAAEAGVAFLKNNPFQLEHYYYVALAYLKQKEYVKAEEYLTQYVGFLEGIKATGNGESYEKAYVIACIHDEYVLMSYLDKASHGQSLQSNQGHSYDVLRSTKINGKAEPVYFDITKPFSSLGKSLGISKEQKGKKKKKK